MTERPIQNDPSDDIVSSVVDGLSTSPQWNDHRSGICILPVGSCEQHGSHLPVQTDSLLADHFSRCLARECDAALLPPLTLACSLEHSGFRGTFSLRPETLMAVIRDVATEAQQQHFKTLSIVSGHGGNIVLGPVVRDWNRSSPDLHLIVTQVGDHMGDCSHRDLHAGERETSMMMHLYPDLVSQERQDVSAPDWLENRIKRSELDIMGVGQISPSCVLGFPSRATAEKGARYVSQTEQSLIQWLHSRLSTQGTHRRYEGAGGITLRPLDLETDLTDALRLSTLAGWNQLKRDWVEFVRFRPEGAFTAVANGRVVGTVTSIDYQSRFSWIGMVLVDPDHRRLGIATRLMNAAMDSLSDCDTLKLDATDQGRPVYERLGFVPEWTWTRWRREPGPLHSSVESGDALTVMDVPDEEWESLCRLDADAFGADRRIVLAAWRDRLPSAMLMALREKQPEGYLLGRDGRTAIQLGPLVSRSEIGARHLLSETVARFQNRPLLIDARDVPAIWSRTLEALGFVPQRQFTRMAKGPNRHTGHPDRQWALSGPELG